jgi:hypothetical protein
MAEPENPMHLAPRTKLLQASLTGIGALALVGATFTGTAFAGGRHDAPGQARQADATEVHGARQSGGDHDGDADRSTSTRYTEDNDTNDGGTPNNVADAGDNRHPSGKDRSVEAGGSGTQGKAESDPDGVKNGGADKPNGPGGIDKADQDGNNGCGNDDDFEDDNNGNCGGRHVHEAKAKPATGQPSKDCSCSHPTTTVTPAAKPAKAEEHKPAKAEQHKPAKAEHSTTSCDRRNDERDQRAVRAHTHTHAPAAPKAPAAPATPGPVVAPVAASTPAPASVTCPAGTEAAMLAGCEAPATPSPASGAVLSESAVAAPAAAEVPAPAEVMAAEAVAPAAPAAVSPASSRSAGTVVAAAASGALAFTGSNLLVLLAVALLTIAVGWFLVRTDRKRHA